jgi:hypothetical protein
MPRKLTYGVPLDTNIGIYWSTTPEIPHFLWTRHLSNFSQQPTISHYYQRVESSYSLPQLIEDAF